MHSACDTGVQQCAKANSLTGRSTALFSRVLWQLLRQRGSSIHRHVHHALHGIHK